MVAQTPAATPVNDVKIRTALQAMVDAMAAHDDAYIRQQYGRAIVAHVSNDNASCIRILADLGMC